jgi:hypothetical protein
MVAVRTKLSLCAHEDGAGKYGCAHEDREDLGVCARSSCAQNGPGDLGKLGSLALPACVPKIAVRKNLDLNSSVCPKPRAGQVLKEQPLAANWVAAEACEFTSI